MKITALIPDELVNEVCRLAKGKTITESLTQALNEWTSLQRIQELKTDIKRRPLSFSEGFSAEKVRIQNRKT
jgi:hypothetical protein